jgi:hypothetical protein
LIFFRVLTGERAGGEKEFGQLHCGGTVAPATVTFERKHFAAQMDPALAFAVMVFLQKRGNPGGRNSFESFEEIKVHDFWKGRKEFRSFNRGIS